MTYFEKRMKKEKIEKGQWKDYKEMFIKYYEFLEELRESGRSNMFGAKPYLVAEFDLQKPEARRIIQSYMEGKLI